MQGSNAIKSLAGSMLALVTLIVGAMLGLFVFVLALVAGFVALLILFWRRRFATPVSNSNAPFPQPPFSRSRRAASSEAGGHSGGSSGGRVIDGTVVSTRVEPSAHGSSSDRSTGSGRVSE